MKLLKAMATVAGLTGLSRIAGFVRDILTAAVLGAGPVADAFFVALKLPNFFRRVTAEGAFSVSFVPVYSEVLEKEGEDTAARFASNAFTIMFLALSIFTALAMIFMPQVLSVVAPGFGDDPLRYGLSVELARVTFPYLLLMSLAALVGGVLNARNHFGPFAFAPVLFNLSLIAALLLARWFETPGHALAWGVAAAGVIQLVWLLVCARFRGVRIRLKRPEMTPRIRKVFRLMGPGAIGAGVMHINLFADMVIASFLPEGAISHLYYADRLNQLPLGTVGIAVGTALLPMLSRAMARGDEAESRDLFNRALEMCLLLALPAAAALAVIPEIIITVLFERGAFTAADSAATSAVLAGYALGLPAYIAVKVFASAHWARQDTATPVKIAVVATIFNIALSLALIGPLGAAGVALATGLAGWVQIGAYLYMTRSFPAAQFDDRFKRNAVKITIASAVMAAAIGGLGLWGGVFLGAGTAYKILFLTGLVTAGMGVYAALIIGSGALRLGDVRRALRRQKIDTPVLKD